MSVTYISSALRRQISEQDRYLCCYCRTAEKIIGGEFTVDHIIPESLGGSSEAHNLCLACWRCNLIKGNRIVGSDPLSEELERSYHPVEQRWLEHFAWVKDALLVQGLTPTGRATVHALLLNRSKLVASRQLWVAADWHPPQE